MANGGSVSRVQRPTGATTSPAIKFPGPGAGQAVLNVAHASSLNPGTADFTITAMVKVTSAEVPPGANLVQKGLTAQSGASG